MTRPFIQTAAVALFTLGASAASATAQPPHAPAMAPPAEPVAAPEPPRLERPLSRMSPADRHHVRDADGAPRVCESRPACHDVIDPKTGRPYGAPS